MRRVTVNASKTYDIIIDKGILQKSGELSSHVVNPCSAAILTDSNVAPLYLNTLVESLENAGFSTVKYIIPAGEESKNAENYLDFLSFLAQNKITRSDCLFALGGGVVGDLCGFAAATYLRGINYVQIPTTLLAMVDSSVGGKTAIDIPEGKNLVGAFYQPSLVICDYATIDTLPKEILADGCAEVIKYGIINDRQLFEKLKSPIMPQIEEVIEACVKNKRDIVNADEREGGIRQLLNLGHTPAHAIEIISDFAISHGRAVAMGIAIMMRASYFSGLCEKNELDEVISLLTSYGLPTKCPYSSQELVSIALSDKKRAGGKISLIMPYGIGNSQIYKIDVDKLDEIFSKGI